MHGFTLAERDAERALYAKVAKMRKRRNVTGVAAALGLGVSRVYALLRRPPYTEKQLEQRARDKVREQELRRLQMDAWKARREARQRMLHEAYLQLQRDEEHEVKAQAAACLIEALAEMRPYVGTEP
jgi:DNA polymerase III delta prime subunit